MIINFGKKYEIRISYDTITENSAISNNLGDLTFHIDDNSNLIKITISNEHLDCSIYSDESIKLFQIKGIRSVLLNQSQEDSIIKQLKSIIFDYEKMKNFGSKNNQNLFVNQTYNRQLYLEINFFE